MLLDTLVNAVHMAVLPLLLLLPVVPDELLLLDELPLLLLELLPLPPASGMVVDELLEQPAR
jgi:hypothetical protein